VLYKITIADFSSYRYNDVQFNCFSLNSIGPAVELVTGPRRFLAVYFTSAVAGVCLSL
jgi:membrane associated rhomboid family serine protease